MPDLDPVLAILEEIVAVQQAVYDRNARLAANNAEARETLQLFRLGLLRAQLDLERERRALQQTEPPGPQELVEVVGEMIRRAADGEKAQALGGDAADRPDPG